jgi:ribosomal protein L37E
METTAEKCLRCGKPSLVQRRGCCRNCYEGYVRAVKRGRTTWGQLEAEGRVKPAVKGDRKFERFFGYRKGGKGGRYT